MNDAALLHPKFASTVAELAERLGQLRAVEQFGVLNREAVRKIIKKFDKKTDRAERGPEVMEEVNQKMKDAPAAVETS